MAYFHGVKVGKIGTSISTPVTADSCIHMIVGTAPVHMVNGKVNEPVYVSSYAEAVEAVGYSDDWEKYDICEEIYTSFKLYQNGPVIIVNVLDPKKHLTGETEPEDRKLYDGALDLPLEALADKVVVMGYREPPAGQTETEGGETRVPADVEYKRGVDYELIYTDGVLRLERMEDGAITSDHAVLSIKYNAVDPSKVTKKDIIGGYDINTKKSSGFELVDFVFPKFRVIPTIFLAPNFSHDSEVAAVMAAKAESINGLFKGKAVIDMDTTEVAAYTEAVEWKNKKNITQPSELLVWPMLSLGGRIFHYSTQLAGLMGKTDANEDMGAGTPCESASNKTLQADSMVLADGTEVLLDLTKANYLNSQGIITGLNFIGGFVSWGNETACYPANTDVTDYFYNVSRMFQWVGNSVILSMWNRVDRNLRPRLVDSIIQSINDWLRGLTSEERILGGRVEFLEEENPAADLMAGIAQFHIYMTPCSPAKELDFMLEYDVSYVQTLFG